MAGLEWGDDEGVHTLHRHDEVDHFGAKVATDIQLQLTGPHLLHRSQRQHILGMNVAMIRPRVDQHGAAAAGTQRRGDTHQVGVLAAARGPQ